MVEKSQVVNPNASATKIFGRYLYICRRLIELDKANKSGKSHYSTYKQTVETLIPMKIVGQQDLNQGEQTKLKQIFDAVHNLQSKTEFKKPDLQYDTQTEVRELLKLEQIPPQKQLSEYEYEEHSNISRITAETKATMQFLTESRYSNTVDRLVNDPLFSANFKSESQQMKNKTLKVDEETASRIYNFIKEQKTLKQFQNTIEKIKDGPQIQIKERPKEIVLEKQKPTLYDRNPQMKAYATQQIPIQEREYYDVETNKIYYPMSKNPSEQEKFMKEALYKIRYMDPEQRKQYKNVISKYEIIAHMNKIIDLSKPSEIQIGQEQNQDGDKQEQIKHLESLYKQYLPSKVGPESKLKSAIKSQEVELEKLKHDLQMQKTKLTQHQEQQKTGYTKTQAGKLVPNPPIRGVKESIEAEIKKTEQKLEETSRNQERDKKELHTAVLQQMQDRARQLTQYRVKIQQDIEEEEAKQGQRVQNIENQLVQAEGRQQHDLAVDIMAQNNQQFDLGNLDQFPVAVKQQQKTVYEKNYESMFPFLQAILQEEQDVQHLTAEQKKLSLEVLDQMEKDPQFFLQQFDFLKKQFDHQPYSSQENARLEQEQQFLKRQAGNVQYFPLNEKTKEYIFSMGGVPWKTNKEYQEEQRQFLGRNQITGEVDEKMVKQKQNETQIDTKELVKMIQNLAKYTGQIGGGIDPNELDLQKYQNKTTIFTPEIKKIEPTQFSFSNSSFRLRTCE